MFDTRSDQERQQAGTAFTAPARPRLSCPGHQFGVWMRDFDIIDTPAGKMLVKRPGTHYRRFCRICDYEQKGIGTYFGNNIKVTG